MLGNALVPLSRNRGKHQLDSALQLTRPPLQVWVEEPKKGERATDKPRN